MKKAYLNVHYEDKNMKKSYKKSCSNNTYNKCFKQKNKSELKTVKTKCNS